MESLEKISTFQEEKQSCCGTRKSAGERKLVFTIPNILGVSRVVAGPVVAYLLWLGHFDFAFWMFVFAGLTDAIDGPIARRTGTVNKFGLYLDPIADKLFINIIYISLLVLDFLPFWIVGLVFLRDFLISGCILLSKALQVELLVHPARLSKINTGLQIALAGIVIGKEAFALPLAHLVTVLMFVIAGTTLISGAQYLARWLGWGRTKAKPEK